MSTAVNTPQTQPESIDLLRAQIDALDAALIRIVAERTRVSRRIQTARMNAGGTRVELGRERTVRATYRDGLGEDGAALAEAVLQVCRGAR
jgi:monofunctional chorismate mutase